MRSSIALRTGADVSSNSCPSGLSALFAMAEAMRAPYLLHERIADVVGCQRDHLVHQILRDLWNASRMSGINSDARGSGMLTESASSWSNSPSRRFRISRKRGASCCE